MASSPLLLREPPRGPAASSTPAPWSCQRGHRNWCATTRGWLSESQLHPVLRPSQAPPTRRDSTQPRPLKGNPVGLGNFATCPPTP